MSTELIKSVVDDDRLCPKCPHPLDTAVGVSHTAYYCGHCDEEYWTDDEGGDTTLRKVGR